MIPLPRLLDSSLNEVKRLHPINVSINENIVPLSTASMTLLPEEEISERSFVELFTVNGSAGIYIAKKPENSYGDRGFTITLEHAVSEIGNWVVKADVEQVEKTLSQAITQVFSYYGGSLWQLGTCSVSGNLIFSTQYGNNLLSTINSLVQEVPAAMVSFDFSTTPWTLNIVSRGTTVTGEGRLSRNIESVRIAKDDSGLCTRVYCNGLGSGGVGIGYMDADTLSTYGVIEDYISGDYTYAQAQIVATQYLNAHKAPKYSISVSMLDLSSHTGESLDSIMLGKLFRIAIPEDNITIEENVTGISWSDVYNMPESASVTLSEEEERLEKFITQTNSYYSEQITTIEDKVKDNDENVKRITSDISKLDDKISLVVTESQGQDVINVASIVLGINSQDTTSQSFVAIQADMIDLHGHVSISDLNEYDENLGSLTVPFLKSTSTIDANYLTFEHLAFYVQGDGVYGVDFVTLNIGGTDYDVLVMGNKK